jgi:hypothetical protein
MTGYTEIGQRMLCQSHNGMDKIWVESPQVATGVSGTPSWRPTATMGVYASDLS